MRIPWDYYDQFVPVCNKYLPQRGEGDTMASQIVTAINKLVFKWYNDGDVFDNTYYMVGWCNDLSSYANWLSKIPGLYEILEKIKVCGTYGEYEDILKNLADKALNEEFLKNYSKTELFETIYDCDGPFKFDERDDDADEEENED